MPDVVTEVRSALEKRLRELEPIVKEHTRIKDALERLTSAVAPARPGGAKRDGGATTTKRPARTGARRGRPRGGGTRSAEALQLVKDQPGITVSEMAKKIGISPNYLYRVLPQLEADKKVTKRGKGYHPAGG